MEVEVDEVVKVYNDIVYYSKAPYCVAILANIAIFRNKSAVPNCTQV